MLAELTVLWKPHRCYGLLGALKLFSVKELIYLSHFVVFSVQFIRLYATPGNNGCLSGRPSQTNGLFSTDNAR